MKISARLEERARKLGGGLARIASDGDRPTAVYARILDGDSIWLAIDGTGLDGPVGLRPRGGRDVLDLVDDSGVREPGRLVVRSLLAATLPEGEGTYDVVASQAGAVVPVVIAALPDEAPTRTPPSRDGRWQHSLGRTGDGTLEVVRRTTAPVAALLAIGIEDDRIAITVRDPRPAERPAPAVIVRGGEVVAELPGTRVADDAVRYLVGDADLHTVDGATVAVEIGGPDGRLPVARPRHVLAAPNKALELPELGVDDPDAPAVVRVRIGPSGELQLRRRRVGG